jgi:hypothetical protein
VPRSYRQFCSNGWPSAKECKGTHISRHTSIPITTCDLAVSRPHHRKSSGVERDIRGSQGPFLLERLDVRLYVRSCHICACTKPLNSRPDDPMSTRKPRQPWEVVSIDLMGPYLRTSRGKSYILVVTDCFSRWTEAYPLGTATTKTIVDTLEREFFSRFGYPRICLRDNGPQFVSDEMLNALKQWGAQGWTTTIYHPRANPVERRNQDLKKGLRATLNDDKHSTWDMKLAPILFTIRNRHYVYTGYPPLGTGTRKRVQKARGLGTGKRGRAG